MTKIQLFEARDLMTLENVVNKYMEQQGAAYQGHDVKFDFVMVPYKRRVELTNRYEYYFYGTLKSTW